MRAAIAALCLLLTGCKPHYARAVAPPLTVEVGRAGASIRGVAADVDRTYVALSAGSKTTIEARSGKTLVWSRALDGAGGPLVRSGGLLVATIGGEGTIAGGPIHGEPGAALVGMSAIDGGIAWRRPFESSEWVIVTTIAPIDGAAIGIRGMAMLAGGTFSGTLRVGDATVSSAGRSEGFVVAIDASGAMQWLLRIGGPGADAVQGIATQGPTIAIAGTVSPGAELAGRVLPAYDERSIFADGFVAVLDGFTRKSRWATTFGGKVDDSVAGVAIANGRVAVAASLREVVHVGGTELVSHGASDGLVAWWSTDGLPGGAARIGGNDFDGITGIVGYFDQFAIAGFYSGTLALDVVPPAPARITAGGGDDAFVLAFDPASARVTRIWQATGDGREEIAAFGIAPSGFVAGVAHTAAATFDGVPLASPTDPMAGAAIVVRTKK